MNDDQLEAAACAAEQKCSYSGLGYGACGSTSCDLCAHARDLRAKKVASRRDAIDREIRRLQAEREKL